jgi:hypothetical protein
VGGDVIRVFLSFLIVISFGLPAAARAAETESEEGEAHGEAAETYVVREEKVVNFETGKIEVEKVIEFPELEILPELARPVEIIIPRTKPNFDQMPFTIYNNEPPSYVPEELRLRYYRRVPVGEEGLGGVKTGDMFITPEGEQKEGQPETKD